MMYHITFFQIQKMKEFPRFGLGTYLCEKGVTQEQVRYAFEECGYRNIDCAWGYGNEEEVGAAFHDLFERNILKREDVWITTKLWCNAHHPKDVEAQCRESLKKLQLEYVDLYLMHFPFAVENVPGNPLPMKDGKLIIDHSVSVIETWKAMEELVRKGLVRHIGVSNFSIELMEKLRYAEGVTIQPFTNQVECHLYLQQGALIDYCAKRGIIVTTHTSIGNPNTAGSKPQPLNDEELLRISKEVNRPPANVAIKFLQSLGSNVTVLVKSIRPERIKANIQLDFELSEEQIERLRKRERYLRYGCFNEMFGVELFGDSW